MRKDIFTIKGPSRLSGTLRVSGSKNAALPILAATLLTEKSCLTNVPRLKDVSVLLEVLAYCGVRAMVREDGAILLDTSSAESVEAPYTLLSKMRASFLVLGPLIARFGHARVALPGGCAIGSRPVDLHLKALEALGAEIVCENGVVIASAPHGLKGAEFYFSIKSVGATENALMAAVLAQGTTVLHNAACEPEVVSLADALNSCGARISGQGTDTIVIEGVSSLEPLSYDIIPDRIEAGTFLIAAVMTQGDITLTHVIPDHVNALLNILRSMHADVIIGEHTIRIIMDKRPAPFELVTEVYPGFSTDLQAQMIALACVCDGVSIIQENVFENRMMHVPELVRMGAHINLRGNIAMVTGQPYLQGAEVVASDLRASAALLLAGLVAQGETQISEIYHMDRGYVCVEERFRSLGVPVTRMQKYFM